MAEFDGRNTGGDDREIPQDGLVPEVWTGPSPEDALPGIPESPRDLFACPFCETPVLLTTRSGEKRIVAECPSCETWFTVEEWRYYKQLVA
jgi:hypothetical protein